MSKIQKLQEFLEKCHVRYVNPSSPDYNELRQQYILDTPAVPLAIARPQSAQDVARIVSYAVAESIEITVRSGGHDLYGRCFVQDALAIDMRDIAFVNVDPTGLSATIGGGILAGSLATELAKQKLTTAYGSVPSVGFVGWSTHGGYGPFVGNYGMGVDLILGAKLVNHEGRVVEADERMLQAIRGGGGTLGVIVEMRIKVFPLDKVLGGMVVFNSKEMTSTIQNFTAGYEALVEEGLPAALGIQQNVLNTPMGKCFAIGFMWSSSDLDTGRKYLDQIASFGQVIFNGVKETTILEWMDGIAMFAPKVAYGRNCTISVHKLTEEAITVIGREIASMPEDRSTLLSIHQLRGSSEVANTNSVFGARTAHYCLEFIATSSEPERTQAVWDWAVRFRDAMRKTDAQNILTSTYISLTPPAEANAPAIYGDNWEKLVEIKRQYDPKNVFKHALPKFNETAVKEEQNRSIPAAANEILHTGARIAFVDPSSVQEKSGSHAKVRECVVISSRDVGLSV